MTTFISIYGLVGFIVSSILLARDKDEIAIAWSAISRGDCPYWLALGVVHLLMIALWPLALVELFDGEDDD